MSIINKMLKDLDRRQGMATTDASGTIAQVRSVPGARKDREWFWRIIAVLMIAAVGWVAWIAWQLRPHEAIATEQAFKAALNAPRANTAAAMSTAPAPAIPAPVPATTVVPPPVSNAPVTPAPDAAPAPAPAVVVAPVPAVTPTPSPTLSKPAAVAQAKPSAATSPREKPAPAEAVASKPAKSTAKLGLDIPPARILEAPAQSSGRVQKVDRTRGTEDRAEVEFRRGAGFLNQGRVSEAEDAFAAALAASPAHEGARQALVALSLEQRRVDRARQLLQEGLAANPGNVQFALVLARIHAERGENAAAFDVLNGVRDRAQASPDYQSLLGNVLLRLGRHAEAGEAFATSLRAVPSNGSAWIGLGISLEAQSKRSEAAVAFQRAMAVTPPGSDLNNLAEQRLRAVR